MIDLKANLFKDANILITSRFSAVISFIENGVLTEAKIQQSIKSHFEEMVMADASALPKLVRGYPIHQRGCGIEREESLSKYRNGVSD